MAQSGRVIFANQLRGVSLLCVLLVHYTTVVHLMRPALAYVIAAPPLDGPIPSVAYLMNTRWLDLGKLGVSVFFLISGFVIPFSLRGAGAGRFLLARALRIYPTFWMALLVEAAAIAASSAYWHISPPFGWRDYLMNGLLVDSVLGLGTVDWVSWTLSVEVKFYVLAAVLRPLILAKRVWPLLAFGVAAAALNALQGAGMLHLPDRLVSEAMFAGFIVIGTLFHYHVVGALSAWRLSASVMILSAAFFAGYALGPTGGGARSLHTASFGLAIVLFAGCYGLRDHFRPNRFLDACAAISYPLYLMHAVVGFTAISFLMMGWRLPYPAALAISTLMAVLIAWALHVFIEMPSVRLGHRVSRSRFAARQRALVE